MAPGIAAAVPGARLDSFKGRGHFADAGCPDVDDDSEALGFTAPRGGPLRYSNTRNGDGLSEVGFAEPYPGGLR